MSGHAGGVVRSAFHKDGLGSNSTGSSQLTVRSPVLLHEVLPDNRLTPCCSSPVYPCVFECHHVCSDRLNINMYFNVLCSVRPWHSQTGRRTWRREHRRMDGRNLLRLLTPRRGSLTFENKQSPNSFSHILHGVPSTKPRLCGLRGYGFFMTLDLHVGGALNVPHASLLMEPLHLS